MSKCYFRYCLSRAPKVQRETIINVQFISDESITRTGAQCTIACIEDSPPPSECMFGYDSVCLSSKSTESRAAYCPSQVKSDWIPIDDLPFQNFTNGNEGDCTCMPVKLIEDSLMDGTSPYGSQSQECFQVDIQYIFSNQTSNCESILIL